MRLISIVSSGIADYVYIGADHRYSEVKADISAWLPKVRCGGVICGHAFTKSIPLGSSLWDHLSAEIDSGAERDYYQEHYVHFGVVRAVNELLPGFETMGQIWWKLVERENGD